MRALVGGLVIGGVLLLGAAPAAPPEYPVNFIKADELKALLDRGTRADIIDVRTWDVYQEMHVKGARSIPIRALESRANEISKKSLVVLY
ncbi:MAG TPA: rhodanese-like domain-containing protein [Methylomirabilota bacterium]|nr:rhodanese-like domain-containing protein [Methylomirabilota bacterium]